MRRRGSAHSARSYAAVGACGIFGYFGISTTLEMDGVIHLRNDTSKSSGSMARQL